MSTVSPTLDVIFANSLSLKFKLNFSFELIDTVTSSWMWGAYCIGDDETFWYILNVVIQPSFWPDVYAKAYVSESTCTREG